MKYPDCENSRAEYLGNNGITLDLYRHTVCVVKCAPTPRGQLTGDLKMTSSINQNRRRMFKLGGAAIAIIPVAAFAAKNESVRKSMQYKDSPEGDKACAGCMQFIPGKSPSDLGGCKVFPGDTEVSPKGYCMAWAKKA